LRNFGYTVIEAENGADALVVAETHAGKIHVVIADIIMPQVGGPELVSRLRKNRQGFAVIFISGYTQAGAFDHGQLGTDAVLLQKPFTAETLAVKIQEVLNSKSSSAAAH
jgi:two-component system cell cycle sensor histidine kinase/response regulator CckA